MYVPFRVLNYQICVEINIYLLRYPGSTNPGINT